MELCQCLVDNGADIDTRNDLGRTALHCAAIRGHVNICQYLLSAGADVHIKTNDEETALDLALRNGLEKVVDLLNQIMNPVHA